MSSDLTLTFGARWPYKGFYFQANGTTQSNTFPNPQTGNFIVGPPIMLVGVSWEKKREDGGYFEVLRNGTGVVNFFIRYRSGGWPMHTPMLFNTGSSIELMALREDSDRVFRESLITLYFEPYSVGLQRQIENVSLDMIPFGGKNVSTNLSFLTFDGNSDSSVTTNGSDARTMFVVPASMTLLSVSFDKRSGDQSKVSYMKLFKNGVGLEPLITLRGLRGVVDLGSLDDSNPAKHIHKGDVIQLQYQAGAVDSIAPGSCLLTLNIKKEMASTLPEFAPAGLITFAGFIDGRRQYLRAGGQVNVRAGVIGTTAVVVVPSLVARVTWQFERNTRHWFQLVKNGEFFADLEMPTPSGVLVLGRSFMVNPGDVLQIQCFHDYWENRFPGPITVTLYMEETS